MKQPDYGTQKGKVSLPVALLTALIVLAGIYIVTGLILVHGGHNDASQQRYPAADHVSIDNGVLYESDHLFQVDPQHVVKQTGFGGKTLGKLILRGDNLTRMEESGELCLISEGDVRFCYEGIRDYTNPQIESSEWKMIDDTATDVGGGHWDNRIGRGGLLVQKSYDGQIWETFSAQTNVFANSATQLDGFCTLPLSDLDIGCYYRVLIAYKMQRETGKNLFVISTFQDLWNVEEYKLYLVGDTARSKGNQNFLTAPIRALRGMGGAKSQNTGAAQAVVSLYGPTVNASLGAAFDESGRYRYSNGDTLLSVELPADQHKSARLLMKKRIDQGQVPGARDPEQADTLVCKGSVSYTQAKNMAQSGKIDALSYDAQSGFVSSASKLGVSSSIVYAMSIWSHDTPDIALQKSLYNGIDVANVSYVVGCIKDQAVSKVVMGAATGAVKPASEALTKALGPKACAVLINATRKGARPIYGAAAMKSASKLFKTSALKAIPVVATIVDIGMQTVPDIASTFRGEMSSRQLAKNLAGVGGGLAGAKAGAMLGTMVVPGVGTMVGGAIGGLVGSFGADAIADLFAKDDGEIMLDIVSMVFLTASNDYLLNEQEAQSVSEKFLNSLDDQKLRSMYASNDYVAFARKLLMPFINQVVENRSAVTIPTDEAQIQACMVAILEDIHDEAA